MEYLLLPFIWFFMLLVWLYEQLMKLVYWFIDDPKPQRKRKGNRRQTGENHTPTKDEQRIISDPEKKAQADNGMNPQERIIPYITPEPVKPEPERKPLPDFKYKPPQVIIDLTPKKSDKKEQGLHL